MRIWDVLQRIDFAPSGLGRIGDYPERCSGLSHLAPSALPETRSKNA